MTLVETHLGIYARAGMSARSIIELQATSSTVKGTAPIRSSVVLKSPWESSK